VGAARNQPVGMHTAEPPPTSGRDGRTLWAHEVTSALATLPRQERTFIRLRYTDGLQLGQIADQAGISIFDVSTIMAAGMRQLAGILEQNNPVAAQPKSAAIPAVLTLRTGRHAERRAERRLSRARTGTDDR
jgi:Sigma-70, region 4